MIVIAFKTEFVDKINYYQVCLQSGAVCKAALSLCFGQVNAIRKSKIGDNTFNIVKGKGDLQ
ncbi:hypothetical protein QFZ73_003175 [Peribacillus sp. V2I11]|nr:hypothetical protein [Peribacillus sp. V2I11]